MTEHEPVHEFVQAKNNYHDGHAFANGHSNVQDQAPCRPSVLSSSKMGETAKVDTLNRISNLREGFRGGFCKLQEPAGCGSASVRTCSTGRSLQNSSAVGPSCVDQKGSTWGNLM